MNIKEDLHVNGVLSYDTEGVKTSLSRQVPLRTVVCIGMNGVVTKLGEDGKDIAASSDFMESFGKREKLINADTIGDPRIEHFSRWDCSFCEGVGGCQEKDV